jgi:uncharacterized protein YndB with AHSA1/START domain
MKVAPTGHIDSDDDGKRTLLLTREFAAPIEDVWAAVTEPERLQRWIGTFTGDPASGRVSFLMTAEGEAPAQDVEIVECDPPRRLVVNLQSGERPWRLELDLAEADGGTRLTFAQPGIDPVEAESVGRVGSTTSTGSSPQRPVVTWPPSTSTATTTRRCWSTTGHSRARGSPLLRGQDAELVATRVGHHHPADVALADVDAPRTEPDEPVDLGRWSPSTAGAMSRCSRFLPSFASCGGPPQVIFGPPRGERIAVSWSWSQTNGHPSAAAQKYPTGGAPSLASAPRNPPSARKALPGSMTQNSLPSGSARTTCPSSGD